MSSTLPTVLVRRHIDVTGAVQGVGFRPFAFRLAVELGLAGFVGNDGSGAFMEVEGPAPAVERFEARLRREAPPLARIETVSAADTSVRGDDEFVIVKSAAGARQRTLVPPDTATCEACLAEIFDPGDRRHRHPFANCCDCGPRFTIIRDLPYDRPSTTMAAFPMCPACAAEYDDPSDRRHHAQPISCPECGPRLRFVATGAGPRVTGTDAAIAAVHAAWASGQVVAVKGIGGYHLTCDATCDRAVTALRERKGRVDKPFAVMVRDLDTARAFTALGPAEIDALSSPERPIVLARRVSDCVVSAQVAPRNPDLGIMLAYSGLHHLLLCPVPGCEFPPPLVIVATSGNRSNEPICTGDEEAAVRMGDLADAFLMHDREIHVACDDSVVRIVGGVEQPVRRSRGYAPLPVALPVEVQPTLAVGGELKSTFCLASGGHGWISQHIGDLENVETLEAFARSVASFQAMYRIEPSVIATDMHPGYLSRRWALEHQSGARIAEVQHHHAHVASLMAEHGLDGGDPVIGIVFDGTGYGSALGSGPAIWGGEVLVADYDGYDRAGHLAELPLPGGDAAVRRPCRLALAYLGACGLAIDDRLPAVQATGEIERRVVARQLETGIGIVPTTSMGRLFDVVASLLGIRHEVSYEAQAAIELEGVAATADRGWPLRFGLRGDGVIDPAPVLAGLADAILTGADTARLALGFHDAVADAVARAASMVAAATGVGTVALSGGVFQNALLSRLCRAALAGAGELELLEHRIVPPNDGGLALGQAAIAGRIQQRQVQTRRWPCASGSPARS
ncbi:MAG: carbamoyltransferase HypF [Solirubrobacteraceae bacterium]